MNKIILLLFLLNIFPYLIYPNEKGKIKDLYLSSIQVRKINDSELFVYYNNKSMIIKVEKSSKSNKTIINILSHNATSFYPKILSIPISRYDNQKQLENRLNPVDIITIVGVGLVIFLIIVVCNFKS
uniref:Transmembrane protein n=1 Tax=Strongyloides stercoralis TaxID=6248 RepID=A0A0K0ET89_STRER